ncbi:peptidoglycan DD-metalloendopeptidase family protein [Carnimonas nigrificans]|uniref:peptidoglycan DD-metalloendopeptidase family protein n=1 Tax=Carnimonas nigrificans TaxID=64323 RepID=UPI00046FEFFC|nr:peptidoglycan DD-metalloendopeptidase family protein [Carnimonas nigrificans]
MVAVLGVHQLTLSKQDNSTDHLSIEDSIKQLIPDSHADTVANTPAGSTVNAASALALVNALEGKATAAAPGFDREALIASVQSVSHVPVDQDDSATDADFEEPQYDARQDSHPALADEIDAKGNSADDWRVYTVQPGDSFTGIVSANLGMGYSEVMRLLKSAPDAKTRSMMTNIHDGSTISYRLNDNGDLVGLRIMNSPVKGVELTRSESNSAFAFDNVSGKVEKTERLFAGTVNGNFGGSAQATGLSSSEVAELTRVLAKKMNFHRQTRDGDHFQVLVQSDVVEGVPVSSRLMAAQYEGANANLKIVRYNDSFYTPDGKSLDPSFKRYPFSGSYRISSPFNLHRHHPVTGRIAPHHGTDFAMPTGTVVSAPSAGRVVQVGYNRFAGKMVVIDHGNGLKTRYLHLSRPLVKTGQQISAGQRIALSGSTGRVTGPHLHYEIMVDNRPVNPMRIKLPEGGTLSKAQLAAFRHTSQGMLAKLNDARHGEAYASAKPAKPSRGDDS